MAGKTEEGVFERLFSGISGFFEERGISPAAGIGFVVILLAAVALIAFTQLSSNQQLKTVVVSSGENLAGANVSVYSQQGQLLASGVTGADGSISFRQLTGKVIVNVSKPGFAAADGSSSAIALVDLAKGQTASIELFAATSGPPQIPLNGGINFTVLDKLTQKPVFGASIDAVVEGQASSLQTDASGTAFLTVSQGQEVKLKVSAPNYFSNTLAFLAVSGAEQIFLSPRVGGGVSFNTGDLHQVPQGGSQQTGTNVLESGSQGQSTPAMPQASLKFLDSNGNAVSSGTVFLTSDSGQQIENASISAGVAQLANLPISGGFSLQIPSLQSGTAILLDSNGNEVTRASIANGIARLSISPPTSLAVSIQTPAGQVVQSGLLSAYDSASNSLLAQFPISYGAATVSGIAANTNVTLVLQAANFTATPVSVVIGQSSALAITAQLASVGSQVSTQFSAEGENGSLISAAVKVYGQGSQVPAFAGDLSQGAVSANLPPGNYSAVFSSPGRLTVTVQGISAGDSVDVSPLPLLTLAAQIQECVTHAGSQTCASVQFSPAQSFTLGVSVSDPSGNPVADALVALRDPQNRTVAQGQTDSDGNATLEGVVGGSYLLATSLSGSYDLEPILLSSSQQFSVVLPLFGKLLLSARTLSGTPVSASFSVAGEGSCPTSASCALKVEADTPLLVTASAAGFGDSVSNLTVSPGAVQPATFLLTPDGSSLEVHFLGVTDSIGRNVSSLLAGQDYLLQFSLFSNAADSTTFGLRLGDKQAQSQQDYGIVDFIPSGFDSMAKSTTYSPQQFCQDLNSNSADDGLYKWIELSVQNNGAPIQRVFQIPVHIRPSATSTQLTLYFRGEAQSGQTVLRSPPDGDLGTQASSSSKADCYSQATMLQLPLAVPNSAFGAPCQIGGAVFADGACLPTAPGRCSNGVETSDPSSCGCPAGEIASGNSCSPASCSDGTPVGQCSQSLSAATQKCLAPSSPDSSPQLTISGDCSCPAGSAPSKGGCTPCTTNDCGASVTCTFNGQKYSQGCLPDAAPLACGVGGNIYSSAVACGCPAGKQFNSASSTCIDAVPPACTDGTLVGTCASAQPKQCTSVGGSSLLVDNALACGCPSGELSDGVSCRSTSGQTVLPTPTPAPGITPIPNASPSPIVPPAPISCSNPNACVSPDSSDAFCSPSGTVQNLCLSCDRSCGGNSLFTCNPSTNACQELRCQYPLPLGTPVQQCVSGQQPKRCALQGSIAVIAQNSGACGCPSGYKPDSNGQSCVACNSPNCANEQPRDCIDAQGGGHGAGECLPDNFSATYGASGAEPIKQCQAGGSIVPNIAYCGCPTGYQRSFDGAKCILPFTPTPSQPVSGPGSGFSGNLSENLTCADCVNNDTLFFSLATGGLEAATGSSSYTMQADTFFPADAFHLDVNTQNAPAPISVQGIESPTQTSPCYSYDIHSGVFSFKTGGDCPIEVQGNLFYNRGLNATIESDSVTLRLRLETVPFKDKLVNITTRLLSLDALHVGPSVLQGPATPQFVFVINNRQTLFGPRTLDVLAQSAQKDQVTTAGVKVLAWKGPGQLYIGEQTQQLAQLSYDTVASYFTCGGNTGPRIEACGNGDPFCCAGGWCNGDAFSQMFGDFKSYARNIAQQTAFRRGYGQPFLTFSAPQQPFELFTGAQVIDGSGAIIQGNGIRLGTFQDCGTAPRPGVYQIRASTSDGVNFNYDSQVSSLQQIDYVGGTCGDPTQFVSDPSLARPDIKAQPLCDFLYGDCSCVQRSDHSVMLTQQQNANGNSIMQMLPLMMMLAPMLQQLTQGLAGLGSGGKGGGTGGNGGGPGGSGTQPGGCTNCGQPSKLAQSLANDMGNLQAKTSPVVPTTFSADQFRSECEGLSGTYENSVAQTNTVCASPEGNPRPNYPAALPQWVDSAAGPPAHVHLVIPGACPPPEEACAAPEEFDIAPDDKNMNEIVTLLNNCEDRNHAPPPGSNINTECSAQVQAEITAVQTRISNHIETQRGICIETCALNGCYIPPACSAYEPCIEGCNIAANDAEAQLAERMAICTIAVNVEEKAGTACESTAKQLIENPGSDLPPSPSIRQAWATCNAWGTQNGRNPGYSECTPVVEESYHFVQLGVQGNAIVQYARGGTSFDSFDLPAQHSGDISQLDPNNLAKYIANARYVPAAGKLSGAGGLSLQQLPQAQQTSLHQLAFFSTLHFQAAALPKLITAPSWCGPCRQLETSLNAAGLKNGVNYQAVDPSQYIDPATGQPYAGTIPAIQAGDQAPVSGLTSQQFIDSINANSVNPIANDLASQVNAQTMAQARVAQDAQQQIVQGMQPASTPFDPQGTDNPNAQAGNGVLTIFDQFAPGAPLGECYPIPDKVPYQQLKELAQQQINGKCSTPFIAAAQTAAKGVNPWQNGQIAKMLGQQGTLPGSQLTQAAPGAVCGSGGCGGGAPGAAGSGGSGAGGKIASQLVGTLLPMILMLGMMGAMLAAQNQQAQANKPGTGQLGTTCSKPNDCASQQCISSTSSTTQGYCSQACTGTGTASNCPSGYVCANAFCVKTVI